ncbi:MAG: nuclear transport factor 2 family protein, partial [Clostridia bacterium]|nr:nuclear transport factor 2 family protein [Clostridia bacterium]
SWLDNDCTVLAEVLSPEALYVESHGPAYKGLDAIQKWFLDWNLHGKVLKWDITRVIENGDSLVCEWYFECLYEGVTSGFNGVTWVVFDNNGLIVELKEFQAKQQLVFPYNP